MCFNNNNNDNDNNYNNYNNNNNNNNKWSECQTGYVVKAARNK